MRTYRKRSYSNVLVLNSDYLPINVTSFKKAFKLVYKGKADIIIEDGKITTSNSVYSKPSVIRLLKFVSLPYRKIMLSRENLFKRDNYQCAYCGANKNLTIDHILPRSKGGKNIWENLITCCWSCNSKKEDQTPEQAGMKLLFKPIKPNPIYFLCQAYKNMHSWKPYLMFGD